MNKISLRKGILAAGLVMALSPAVLLADDVTPTVSVPADAPVITEPVTPAVPQTPAEVKKAKEQQKRKAAQQQSRPAAQPEYYEQIQDIPDPKNLGSD